MRSRASWRPSLGRACKPMSWWKISAARAGCSRSSAPRARRPDGRTILFPSVGAFVITNALKPQARLRAAESLRAGRARRRGADAVHRQGGLADQVVRRSDREGEGRSEALLRFGRQRHHDAYRGRAVEFVRQDQDHARALPRHRARAQRHHGRAHRFPERRHHGALSAGEAGHDPRARARRLSALAAAARRAGHRRSSVIRASSWRTGTARSFPPRRRRTWWRSSKPP